MEKFRLTVEDLPELETEVAISGSVKQQEIGGGVCLGIGAGSTPGAGPTLRTRSTLPCGDNRPRKWLLPLRNSETKTR
jgi:hypothetical protein